MVCQHMDLQRLKGTVQGDRTLYPTLPVAKLGWCYIVALKNAPPSLSPLLPFQSPAEKCNTSGVEGEETGDNQGAESASKPCYNPQNSLRVVIL